MKLLFLISLPTLAISCVSLLTLAASQTHQDVDKMAERLWGPLDADTSSNNTATLVTEPQDTQSKLEKNNICKCVPYNLCNSTHYGVDVYDPARRGRRLIQIRSAGVCPVSGDECCISVLPKQEPGPSKAASESFKQCGYRNIGGVGPINTAASAQFAEFPWVLALFHEKDKSDSYIGVGALIRPSVVITVAHIIRKYSAAVLRVRGGEWDLRNTHEIYYHQERGVKGVYIHEEFNPKSFKNDIALLRLERPFPITEHIDIVCRPDSKYNLIDKDALCFANGWGQTEFGIKEKPSILKKVDLKVVDSEECTAALQKTRLGPNYTLDPSFICYMGDNGADMCQGDGGGPLVCKDYDGFYLRGLVSYGVGCGEKDIPGVYTNIVTLIDWIEIKLTSWGLGT